MKKPTDILSDFRDGLEKGLFSIVEVERLTGIPHATLRYMRRPEWQEKPLLHIDKLETALETLSTQKEPEVAK